VLQWVHAGVGDIRIVLEVVRPIKLRDRADLPGAARRQEMPQAEIAFRDVVLLAVPGRVEVGNRAAPLRLASLDVVQQRVRVGAAPGAVAADVVGRIEIRIGPPAFAPAEPVEVQQGVMVRRGEVLIPHGEPCAIE